MKKIWPFISGVALLFAASAFALLSPEKFMTGDIFGYLFLFPTLFILAAWRLEIVPLILVIGFAMIFHGILKKTRVIILSGWIVIYFVYFMGLHLSGKILLIQNFRFNNWRDFLFLFLLSLYTSLLLPIILDSSKRNDVIGLGIGICGLSMQNIGGWWSGPQGFEIGTTIRSFQFANIWLFIILLIISSFALIINVVKNLINERKDLLHV